MSLFEIKVDDDIFRIPEALSDITLRLSDASAKLTTMQDILENEDVFQGKAREELLLFIQQYSICLGSLYKYYNYASQYTTNAYIAMLEADSALQEKFKEGIQTMVETDPVKGVNTLEILFNEDITNDGEIGNVTIEDIEGEAQSG